MVWYTTRLTVRLLGYYTLLEYYRGKGSPKFLYTACVQLNFKARVSKPAYVKSYSMVKKMYVGVWEVLSKGELLPHEVILRVNY